MNCAYLRIPRSREVGQSYISSIFTTLHAIFACCWLVGSHAPELLLCNGPGTCLPVIVIVWLFNICAFRHCRIIFIESFCRVNSLSLCGILVYPLVHRFIVQWPKLTKTWTLTEYVGRLC
jgi:beta-1,4-N-acetylglucosaminyltransferase